MYGIPNIIMFKNKNGSFFCKPFQYLAGFGFIKEKYNVWKTITVIQYLVDKKISRESALVSYNASELRFCLELCRPV